MTSIWVIKRSLDSLGRSWWLFRVYVYIYIQGINYSVIYIGIKIAGFDKNMEGNRKHMKTSFHPMAWFPCKFHPIRWGWHPSNRDGFGLAVKDVHRLNLVLEVGFDEHLASTPFVRGSQSP